MYGYNNYVQTDKETLLSLLDSQESVFNLIITEEIKLNKESLYKAPYREDNHASCYFEYYNDILYFIDFPDGKPKNCINFISRCYNISYMEAMEFISEKFNLGLGFTDNCCNKNSSAVKQIIKNKSILYKPALKINKNIKIFPRNFEIKDKKFWCKYGITKQQLIDDKVVPVKAYEAYNKKGELFNKITPVGYAFTDFDNNKVKIYCPYDNKFGKWFTNCSSDDIGNIKDLIPGKLLIITKSYKDCRVLRNLGYNSIWFQNEGMIPNKNILFEIMNKVPEIYIWFDNDNTGISKSIAITDYLKNINRNVKNNIASITLPPVLLDKDIKDPSDYIKTFGKNSLLNFINNKIK